MATAGAIMEVLRTPEQRFAALPGYPFAPHYVTIDGLRLHYVDEGPEEGEPVLLLHGEPSWSYLYRTMIPPIAAAGYRAIAPDMIGFGRSDKPARRAAYTYQRLVDWMAGFIEALDLRRVTLVCQDWGGLIGLRLAAEHDDRFVRIVAANTGLPTGDVPLGRAFEVWQRYSRQAPDLPIGAIIARGCVTPLAPEVVAAYDAPFLDASYKEGARQLPLLVPTTPDDPAAPANRRAWQALARWRKPFLTAFSDSDPITRGGDTILQRHIPGAHGMPHTTIAGAGHFVQEDKGPELTRVVLDFMRHTPLS